jgi:peroxiredoxin
MKYIIPFICFCLVAVSASSQKGYTVKGFIKGAENKMIYLNPSSRDEIWQKDSVFSADGNFSFKGNAKFAMLYNVSFAGYKKRPAIFILENKNISITGDTVNLYGAAITGSSETDRYKAFTIVQDSFNKVYNRIMKEVAIAAKTKDSAKIKQSDDEWRQAGNNMLAVQRSFIVANPKAAYSLVLCNGVVAEPDTAAAWLSFIHKSLKEHPLYDRVTYAVAVGKRIGIGKPAPEIKLPDTRDATFSLASLKGKYVLIDFWASWCVPCRKETPNLQKAYAALKGKGFEILSVSIDEKKELWLKAVETDNMLWPNILEQKGVMGQVAKLYGISLIPKNFLIDREGKFVAFDIRGEKTSELIEGFMK